MRTTSIRRAFATGVAGATLGALALPGVAAADPADDAAIIIENLPEAVEVLADGLAAAADEAAETQSTVATFAVLSGSVAQAGGTLVEGTEQFGALGLGLLLLDLGAQEAVAPFLGAIDDPASAADLLDPADLDTLQENSGPALDHVQENATTALIELLRGNLVAPGLLDPATGTPSAFGNLVAITGDLFTGGAAFMLLEGTTFQGIGTLIGISSILGGAIVGGFAGEDLQGLEDELAPLFEAAEPVTSELIAVLEGL